MDFVSSFLFHVAMVVFFKDAVESGNHLKKFLWRNYCWRPLFHGSLALGGAQEKRHVVTGAPPLEHPPPPKGCCPVDPRNLITQVDLQDLAAQVLRVVDGDKRPTIGLVYAKIETAKKKICEVSPRYAHLVLDVVEDRWDLQMSKDLHMAAYYLHPAYHYAMELSYDDELMAAFTRIVERLSKSALDAADAIDEASINLPT
ncbi:hypothetical protein Taro_039120 [Colocasia esculenta]|uniref:Uncharacterized protein n=1 Tax=Colocasia esculenta TaxID=4460 RepID=A0A843W9U7_COLES|nr:hypothetical protein [Colocasia esculenta]